LTKFTLLHTLEHFNTNLQQVSSNIQVQRICQHCGKEFTARTTVTKFCGDDCAKRAYKARQKAVKIEASNSETQRIKTRPIEQIKEKEFLTVTQVSKLIGCSRQNVYKLINTGKLKATNLLLKKTIVKRSEIDKLFA
jgi:excisionase family DNA binding protein